MSPERADVFMDVPYPQYRCAICGKDLPLTDARMTVTCDEHRAAGEQVRFEIRPATAADQHAIEAICDQAWGETEIDVFGRTFDVLVSENLIAVADCELAGLISLAVHQGELAIVLLSVYPRYQGSGVGAELIEAAVGLARDRGLTSVKVAVSNDDVSSLYFYQRRGFVLFDIAIGTIADRQGAAVAGFAGIPMRDELYLRRPVCR